MPVYRIPCAFVVIAENEDQAANKAVDMISTFNPYGSVIVDLLNVQESNTDDIMAEMLGLNTDVMNTFEPGGKTIADHVEQAINEGHRRWMDVRDQNNDEEAGLDCAA